MHHIFINENEIDLSNKLIKIDRGSENYNHLAKSLRVEKDENILCSVLPFINSYDYRSKVLDVNDEYITLLIEENVVANELPVKINIYQGIAKFDKFEFIIEKAVELGVYSVIPVATEYCVAKIDDKKSEKKIDRYNKISRSAAEQSKRHIVPHIGEPIDFKKMIEILSVTNVKKYNLLFYENAEGISKTREVLKEIANVVKNEDANTIEINVVIGPEGGFSEKEIELAKNMNFNILSLGDRILRTETAAITAMSILMYEFNSIV